MMASSDFRDFQNVVWAYYQHHARHDLPWRIAGKEGFDPHRILVSELMLQQTQVNRVILKYEEFLRVFPSLQDLAQAELGEVLRLWNGLGYNRRAKFLWQAARAIVHDYQGKFPETESELVSLPGIGKGTAGAIRAYAFNRPVAFIETNIRTVFIHHFFKDGIGIPDSEILELVQATVDKENPREWYWALMDYGSHLKRTVGNLNHLSKSYSKQSKFHGSLRQVRGQIIRLLGEAPRDRAQLASQIADDRLDEVINALLGEGLIRHHKNKLSL